MKALQRQLKIVKNIAEEAKGSQDYKIAHDPDILGAINIVEEFLKKKKRICYGGQAINAHLPKKYKFYSEEDLPDYDFFTPTPEDDIEELVNMYASAGYTEIGIRLSVHEGTTKLYINFMPMADITGIEDVIYKRLFTRAVPYGGIYYADPDFLRMMMYLELSRPTGEVERWEKVYERLYLLNTLQPIKKCKWRSDKYPSLIPDMQQALLETIIDRGNVLAGLDVYSSYKSRKRHTIKWFMKSWPIVFYAEKPDTEVKFYMDYLSKLGLEDVKYNKINQVGELVPASIIIKHQEVPIILIIKETACHGYNNMTLIGGKAIKVASIDTLITLFMSFMFHPELDEILARPLLCLVHEMILFSMRARETWDKSASVPFISITCSGHQKQIGTLLKERAERIRNTRKKAKEKKLAEK
jgi:hypothetical protein